MNRIAAKDQPFDPADIVMDHVAVPCEAKSLGQKHADWVNELTRSCDAFFSLQSKAQTEQKV